VELKRPSQSSLNIERSPSIGLIRDILSQTGLHEDTSSSDYEPPSSIQVLEATSDVDVFTADQQELVVDQEPPPEQRAPANFGNMADANVELFAAAVAAAVRTGSAPPAPNYTNMLLRIETDFRSARHLSGRDANEIEALIGYGKIINLREMPAALTDAMLNPIRKQIFTYYYVVTSGWATATHMLREFAIQADGAPPIPHIIQQQQSRVQHQPAPASRGTYRGNHSRGRAGSSGRRH